MRFDRRYDTNDGEHGLKMFGTGCFMLRSNIPLASPVD